MSDDRVMAALARLEEGQSKLQARFEERLTRLEDGQTKLRVDVMDRLDRHEDRLTKLEAGQSQLRGDMLTHFEKVENRLTSIREDISVNFGRADHAEDSARRARDELRSLWRMIQRLQTDVEELKSGK